MSACLDAGTGCGWCIPFLVRIQADPDGVRLDETPEEYEARRRSYIDESRPRNRF